MSGKALIWIVLFVLSELLGIAFGEWFFRLYLKAVPPMALSDFNTQSSRIAHLLYGAGVGMALFIWALLGMGTGRLLQMMSRPETRA
jgi:hypothetical protein